MILIAKMFNNKYTATRFWQSGWANMSAGYRRNTTGVELLEIIEETTLSHISRSRQSTEEVASCIRSCAHDPSPFRSVEQRQMPRCGGSL